MSGAGQVSGAEGFPDGEVYHRARPGYPPDAVEFVLASLRLGPASRVVDLGAGTGILTRQLIGRVGQVVAVEPAPGMRAVLERVDGVTVLDGRDTAIPLGAGVAEAVVVAQAFHWFDASRALAEIHRVLVPGGGLALIWNNRDESVAWVAAFSRAMRWDVCRPYDPETDYGAILAAGPFIAVARRRFAHVQMVDRAQLYRRVLSTSYVALMGTAERDALMENVRRVVEPLPEPIAFPHVTDVWRAVAVS